MAYQKQYLNVKDIRYSQDTISDTFCDGRSLKCTIDMLKSGKTKPENIKQIRVGRYNGHYITIDNRRLYCFKQSNIKQITVKYIPDIGNLQEFHHKYTSNNDGTSIKLIKIKKKKKKPIMTWKPVEKNTTVTPTKSTKIPTSNNKNSTKVKKYVCEVCVINMTLPDKMSHLNGRRHHKNLKNQNADNSIKNKKLSYIGDEAIACGLKSVDKNTTVTHTKSTKITNNNNKNAPIDMKKTVRKPPLSVQKSIKNKSENDKLVSVSQNIKALGSNVNNKGIYDVKVRIEPVISYKPKTNDVLHSRELQLEQQVNAYKIKFDLMQQQIHNYEIKLRKMEQEKIAIDVDDIDFDLDNKKQYKFENKKNICICAVMSTLGSVGALYFLAKKYI